jgi:intracellular multiplication protein IcmO
MANQIDRNHEVSTDQRIADVRPWSEKIQEQLSSPLNSGLLLLVLGVLSIAAPALSPIFFVTFLVAHVAVMSLKNVLPYRYPSYKGVDPDSGKKGDGILYIGGVRSNSPYEKFKQCWLSDNDLRKHWLIIGTTGSGKSETLKGIFYNALCWGSGFFCADGKADNGLPTDGFTMCRAFARDDDVLVLNFLLGGKTPQQVAKSRRRRSNRLNPFSSSDADTLIQMGANLLPKAEGDGKSWQEKALALWRAVVTALCYKRDTSNFTLSVGTIIDYLALTKIEELSVEGFREAQTSPDGSWSSGYASIKNYLDSGLPAYSVEKLQKKHGLTDSMPAQPANRGARPAPGRDAEQDPVVLEQHGYRAGQLMPVLNLLDKTYGYIFRAPFSEIDMIDVALHNRILFLLIPSLEKSSQEAENLGKLAIACLRVMMAKNLGSEVEGTREEIIDSKATLAPYPYLVALDELGYYFADGIAVMFAQARSLGMSMIAAAQDLEKLMEGNKAAEAGAMIGNTDIKIIMKINDGKKTYELASNTFGKAFVASHQGYESGEGIGGYKRDTRLNVAEVDRISYGEMLTYKMGWAVMSALGNAKRISTFYMGDWLKQLNNKEFHVNRFLQVHEPTDEDVLNQTIEIASAKETSQFSKSDELMSVLRGGHAAGLTSVPTTPVFDEIARVVQIINSKLSGLEATERGVLIYLAIKRLLQGKSSQAKDFVNVNAEDIADSHPVSAGLLRSEEGMSLAQTLDEYGLPDPLSLIRKPVFDILAPIQEEVQRQEPKRNGAFYSSDPEEIDPGSINKNIDENPALYGFEEVTDEPIDPIDEIMIAGRPDAKPGTSAAWVSKAIVDAHNMVIEPRSADNTAIGLSPDTMTQLEGLERELGSSIPKTTARSMQKVVSAQITPDILGKGTLTMDDIELFFNNAIGSAGDSQDPDASAS